MNKKQQLLRTQQQSLGIQKPTQAALLNVMDEDGLHFSSSQLAYMERMHDEASQKLTCCASSAQRMIETLKENPAVSYIMFTYTPSTGIICKPKSGGRKQIRVSTDFKPKPTLDELYQEHLLDLDGEKRLLLLFMFMHDSEFRLLKMHPHVCGIDAVGKVNNLKKDVSQ